MLDKSQAQEQRPYWDKFYANPQAVVFPSQFACMVASELEKPSAIVDLGCGNGRDSFFLAQLGHKVLGLDRSTVAVETDTEKAHHYDNPPRFEAVDFMDGALLAEKALGFFDRYPDRPRVFYCRFVIHSLTDEAEDHLFESIRPLFRQGDQFFAEFRTAKDADKPKIFGNHYRRFVELDDFLARAEQRRLRASYRTEGVGMALFRGEDPTVARVILTEA